MELLVKTFVHVNKKISGLEKLMRYFLDLIKLNYLSFRVQVFSQVNKMSAQNLALVLVPSLFKTINQNLVRLTKDFIIHHTLLFLVNTLTYLGIEYCRTTVLSLIIFLMNSQWGRETNYLLCRKTVRNIKLRFVLFKSSMEMNGPNLLSHMCSSFSSIITS